MDKSKVLLHTLGFRKWLPEGKNATGLFFCLEVLNPPLVGFLDLEFASTHLFFPQRGIFETSGCKLWGLKRQLLFSGESLFTFFEFGRVLTFVEEWKRASGSTNGFGVNNGGDISFSFFQFLLTHFENLRDTSNHPRLDRELCRGFGT